MFEYIERKRKIIFVILGLFLLVLGVFFAYMSMQVMNFQGGIEAALEHREEELEEYKDIHIRMNINFLEAIEVGWNNRLASYKRGEISEGQFLEGFLTEDLELIQNTADFFLIVAERDGEIIYEEYEIKEYENVPVEWMLKSGNGVSVLQWVDSPYFINASSQRAENFGAENRLFYNSKKLEGPVDIRVYCGFLEQAVYQQFVDTLDVTRITELEKAAGRSLIATMITVVLSAILAMFLLHQILGLGRSFKGTELNRYYAFMLLSKFMDKDEELGEFVQQKIDEENLTFRELMNAILEYCKKGDNGA